MQSNSPDLCVLPAMMGLIVSALLLLAGWATGFCQGGQGETIEIQAEAIVDDGGQSETEGGKRETKPADSETEREVTSYSDAGKQSRRSGRPILALLSATWCGPCRRVEQTTLPQLRSADVLRRVVLVVIDVDRERALASRLCGGAVRVPQWIMVQTVREEGDRPQAQRRLIGERSAKEVLDFVNEKPYALPVRPVVR